MSDLIERARLKVKKLEKLRKDARVKSVISFLIKKGLLVSNNDFGYPPRTIAAKDCIFVAENFEPRVYAVLPAAMIHFKNSITEPDKLPLEIRKSVKAILKNEEINLVYKGIHFSEMKMWANKPLSDRRTKPISEKKVLKTFRLAPKTVKKLENLARKEEKDLTAILEEIILKAS